MLMIAVLFFLQEGKTPLDIAIKLKFKKIVAMLEKSEWNIAYLDANGLFWCGV